MQCYIYSREQIPDTWFGRNFDNTSFSRHFRGKWDEIYTILDVFNYKLKNLRVKLLDQKYLMMLNPNRGTKRRIPERMDNTQQPFDANNFNFNKIDPAEVMFKIIVDESDFHTVVVNVSPISKYHSLLCPSVEKCLPQVLTQESIELALDVMFLSQDRDFRIAFNSLCALASVNHLHFHLFAESHDLPIEYVKCHHLKGPLYYFTDYPTPAFCFGLKKKIHIKQLSEDIYKLVAFLLQRNIAHNMFITRGIHMDDDIGECIRVIIWPRKNNCSVKQFGAFNTAVLELSGWITVYTDFDFDLLTTKDIEMQLKRSGVDDFERLCDSVKMHF